MESITIAPDLNGPRATAQGGIAAGLLAAGLEGPVRVRLHRPPPLGVPLDVAPDGDGLVATLGADVVLSAERAPAPHHPPPGVTVAEAATVAMDQATHVAQDCVVCGPRHPRTLGIFPAPVREDVVALRWRPAGWYVDGGAVRPEIVWGVLDCPGALACHHAAAPGHFPALGTITAALHAPVPADRDLLVIGWHRGTDGRKSHGSTAILDADGGVLAVADLVCVAVPVDWAR